ncbi:hypothetical protein FJ208_01910 [Candidatus Gribaldobacteria bacterium]|nr:hypothetical protein [Candidatus Gribaldobacteria bacterium]
MNGSTLIKNNNILQLQKLISACEVVILPLKKWKNIENDLEDLEMYRSTRLAGEIKERRKDKLTVALDCLLKKYKI